MTATTETRKRTREDDGSDSVPLSKRINNLHINNNIVNIPNNHILPHNSHENGIVNNSNGNYPTQLENVDSSDGQHHQSPGDHFYHNNGDESNSAITQQYHTSPDFGEHYNPELNQHENPYYYSKNKLLYELHIERLRRAQN